jgi:hypothetical protein
MAFSEYVHEIENSLEKFLLIAVLVISSRTAIPGMHLGSNAHIKNFKILTQLSTFV